MRRHSSTARDDLNTCNPSVECVTFEFDIRSAWRIWTNFARYPASTDTIRAVAVDGTRFYGGAGASTGAIALAIPNSTSTGWPAAVTAQVV